MCTNELEYELFLEKGGIQLNRAHELLQYTVTYFHIFQFLCRHHNKTRAACIAIG